MKEFGEHYILTSIGNAKADELAALERNLEEKFQDQMFEGSNRWIIQIDDVNIESNLLKEIKKTVCNKEQHKIFKNNRYQTMISKEVIKDQLNIKFASKQFRKDKINNWWFHIITKNLIHASKLSHWTFNEQNNSMYKNPNCQQCN